MFIRDVLTGGRSGESGGAQLALTVLRIFTGLSLAIAHGWGKMPPSDRFIEGVGNMGFPLPILFAYAAGLSEFAGGLLLAVGAVTRPSAFFIFITMMVAGFIRHADDPFGSMEKALLYAGIALVFFVVGGGRYSVDGWLRRFTQGTA